MNAIHTGTILVLGGHVPIDDEGSIVVGKVGRDLDVNAAQGAARLAALSALDTLRRSCASILSGGAMTGETIPSLTSGN